MPAMPYNGTDYWIGFHQVYGLLLYDPGAPACLGDSYVHLFDVSRAAFEVFPRDVVGRKRVQELWSAVDPHRRKDMSRQVQGYDERKEHHRARLRRQLRDLRSSGCTPASDGESPEEEPRYRHANDPLPDLRPVPYVENDRGDWRRMRGRQWRDAVRRARGED